MAEPIPTPMPDRARALRQRARMSVQALPQFGPYAEARATLEGLVDLVVDLTDRVDWLQRREEGRRHE